MNKVALITGITGQDGAYLAEFHEAKFYGDAPVELWGTGSPMWEFLHVDDLGKAVIFALKNTMEEYLYNVGTGSDLTIKKLAKQIQSTIGHKGRNQLG